MESIIGKLTQLENSPDYSVDKVLVKKFLKNFNEGNFLNQKNLAQELFISESAITKFCQKLGYHGFREFNERFKLEYEKYVMSKHHFLDYDDFVQKFFASINDIENNQQFSQNFKAEVLAKRGLYLYPSCQSEEAAGFIRDYLLDQGIDARLFCMAKNNILNIIDYLDHDYPVLFIFTGSDNFSLYRAYEQLKENDYHPFVITSNGQKDRVNETTKKFILTSHIKYSGPYYRRVILEFLFLSIFEQTN